MSIKKIDYSKNKQKTLEELENYTKTIVPELKHEYKEISFVYESEGIILGRIVGVIHWDYLQIELFFVSTNTQGKGIGTKLLTHVESIAQEEGLSYIILETMSFNAPRFYEKNGYHVIAKIEHSPLEKETRYIYKKALK